MSWSSSSVRAPSSLQARLEQALVWRLRLVLARAPAQGPGQARVEEAEER
jgi:hypothetical protein